MARKPRVDKASERKFAKLCSDAGIFCQIVTEDETGWDCLVEFPPEGHAGPAESQSGGKRGYVQIKSRVQRAAQTEITLSNARKMVQDPAPWFIVLFHEPHRGRPEIYAKHIWRDLIADSLKRIRQADIKGEKLHRRRMTITFEESDRRTDDLCSWMEEVIDEIGRGYSELKRDLFELSGYEDGYGTGSFTVRASSRDEIADAFLGLGDGVEIADWKFVGQRFGIAAPASESETSRGRLTVTPLAHEKCAVRLRHPRSGEVIALDGTFMHNGLAAFDPKLAKARLQAGFLDVTFSLDATFNLSVKADLDKAYPLSHWRDYARTLIWLRDGEAHFEIWFRDKRIFEAQVSDAVDGDELPTWLTNLVDVAEKLKQIAGKDYEFHLNDLIKASKQISALLAVSFSPSMAFQYPIPDVFPDEFDQSLFYAVAPVGDRVFCSMVARPVIGGRLEGENERRLLMGPARLLDHYATADLPERQRQLLQAKFETLIETLGDQVLGLGDIDNVLSGQELQVTVGGRKRVASKAANHPPDCKARTWTAE